VTAARAAPVVGRPASPAAEEARVLAARLTCPGAEAEERFTHRALDSSDGRGGRSHTILIGNEIFLLQARKTGRFLETSNIGPTGG
jgi:hypothetical protein